MHSRPLPATSRTPGPKYREMAAAKEATRGLPSSLARSCRQPSMRHVPPWTPPPGDSPLNPLLARGGTAGLLGQSEVSGGANYHLPSPERSSVWVGVTGGAVSVETGRDPSPCGIDSRKELLRGYIRLPRPSPHRRRLPALLRRPLWRRGKGALQLRCFTAQLGRVRGMRHALRQ